MAGNSVLSGRDGMFRRKQNHDSGRDRNFRKMPSYKRLPFRVHKNRLLYRGCLRRVLVVPTARGNDIARGSGSHALGSTVSTARPRFRPARRYVVCIWIVLYGRVVGCEVWLVGFNSLSESG